MEQHWRSFGICHNDVDPAVIIKVAGCQSAAHNLPSQVGAGLGANIRESLAVLVTKQHGRLPIPAGGLICVDVVRNVAVRIYDVQITIVVEIEQLRSKSKIWKHGLSDPVSDTMIGKVETARIDQNQLVLQRKRANYQIDASIEVHVSVIHPHAAIWLTSIGICHASYLADVLEFRADI